jgi:hypothetical protein
MDVMIHRMAKLLHDFQKGMVPRPCIMLGWQHLRLNSAARRTLMSKFSHCDVMLDPIFGFPETPALNAM